MTMRGKNDSQILPSSCVSDKNVEDYSNTKNFQHPTLKDYIEMISKASVPKKDNRMRNLHMNRGGAATAIGGRRPFEKIFSD
jgi:hypothetical protein